MGKSCDENSRLVIWPEGTVSDSVLYTVLMLTLLATSMLPCTYMMHRWLPSGLSSRALGTHTVAYWYTAPVNEGDNALSTICSMFAL